MNKIIRQLVFSIGLGVFSGWVVAADEISAVLDWSAEYRLSLPVSGRITDVKVDVGMRVKKGDELLRLDTSVRRAELVRTESVVVQKHLQEAEARKELERAQELFERTVLSERDLQQATIEHASAVALWRSAESELVQAQTDLSDSVLLSPIDGLVTKVLVNVGETVTNRFQAHMLIVVVSTSPMHAIALVGQNRLRALTLGDFVDVVVGTKTFQGRVSALGVEPERDEKGSALYILKVAFDVGNEGIAVPGRRVKLRPVSSP